MNFEDQFFIAEKTVYYAVEDGSIVKGWDSNKRAYFSGNPVWIAEHLTDRIVPPVKLKEETLYYVCDYTGAPVGNRYDRDYSYASKKGVVFPSRMRQNGFIFYDDAEKALQDMRIYMRRFKQAITTKKDKHGQFAFMFQQVCLTETAEKMRRTMNDMSENEKRKRTSLSEFDVALLEELD